MSTLITPRRLLLGAALTLPSLRASAQSYPNRPVRLILGYPPGGSNDASARVIQPRLQELLGQPVVIENRTGANGTLATEYVARSAPDGHTLFLGSSSPLVIAPYTSPNISYDTARDFAALGGIAATPSVLAVGPALPVRTFDEFVAAARQRQINLASSGAGGLGHLAIEVLRRDVSQNITHVPYRGGAPATTDTVSGNVHGIVVDLAAIQGHLRDGRMRAIAVMSERRSSMLPDVTTFSEAGMPGVVAVNWIGVMAPVRTPDAILDQLQTAILQASTGQDVRDRFTQIGMEPFTHPSRAAAQAFITSELERWSTVARATGARADG